MNRKGEEPDGITSIDLRKIRERKKPESEIFDEDEIVLLNTEKKELPFVSALRRPDAVMILTRLLQQSTRTRRRRL